MSFTTQLVMDLQNNDSCDERFDVLFESLRELVVYKCMVSILRSDFGNRSLTSKTDLAVGTIIETQINAPRVMPYKINEKVLKFGG